MADYEAIARDCMTVIRELAEAGRLKRGHVLVIGASTSEVTGRRIGTAGTTEVAAALYEAIERSREAYGFIPAFQCCEHLNRALVVEREAAERFGWEEVSAVPVPHAGGLMAAYAYRRLASPVLVEEIRADAGIDIGDTLIGMHLKRVAVPFRASVKRIGEAHVTAAFTRPKLIGGERAVYRLEAAESASSGE
jgi:uncharacterized protein (TIGR01440 family)